MRLVTFDNAAKQPRIGAVTAEEQIVDLNSACALYLRDVENEGAFYRLADALVPAEMRQLFEGGDTSLEAAHKAFDYAVHQGNETLAPRGETIFHNPTDVRLRAPIIPKKFFHTAGNFREHHEEATKAGFSHPVMPWIVFFQNVDAIIGHEEAVVYPEHLTQELELPLEMHAGMAGGASGRGSDAAAEPSSLIESPPIVLWAGAQWTYQHFQAHPQTHHSVSVNTLLAVNGAVETRKRKQLAAGE